MGLSTPDYGGRGINNSLVDNATEDYNPLAEEQDEFNSNTSRAPPVEYNYETIHSLSIYGCELGQPTKEGLRSWNMTVQYWLAAYCHHRLPHSLKAYRVAITMTISAF
ncbi:membrane-bound acylglycerophosphatidylinositol O-acyltransferase MBOAT7-like [Crassostrea virginica]